MAHCHAPPLSDPHHHQYGSDTYAGSGLRLLLCLAEAWVKFPEETKKAVLTADLDPWVFRKFVQKARESRRVSDEDKEYLKSLLS